MRLKLANLSPRCNYTMVVPMVRSKLPPKLLECTLTCSPKWVPEDMQNTTVTTTGTVLLKG